jgi:hypothetical protein
LDIPRSFSSTGAPRHQPPAPMRTCECWTSTSAGVSIAPDVQWVKCKSIEFAASRSTFRAVWVKTWHNWSTVPGNGRPAAALFSRAD